MPFLLAVVRRKLLEKVKCAKDVRIEFYVHPSSPRLILLLAFFNPTIRNSFHRYIFHGRGKFVLSNITMQQMRELILSKFMYISLNIFREILPHVYGKHVAPNVKGTQHAFDPFLPPRPYYPRTRHLLSSTLAFLFVLSKKVR